VSSSPYDAAAPSFDRYRALPGGLPEALRFAVLGLFDLMRPRLLDLGSGTGRIGRVFVAAGDDYVGVDLSLGMLREFARRNRPCDGRALRLVQADGERLPFVEASFDAVMMIQVLGAARRWRPMVNEALRVLRAPGTLLFGHTVMPKDGLDTRMKQQLARLLAEMSAPPYHRDPRAEVIEWLNSVATSNSRVIAAKWEASRTPAGFLARQPSGAQFALLPQPTKDAALAKLAVWAATTFGSLDAEFSERHAFELNVFRFQQAARR
jgi:ubiquinone/menaquinone biosynthesis C-methylase UbiE